MKRRIIPRESLQNFIHVPRVSQQVNFVSTGVQPSISNPPPNVEVIKMQRIHQIHSDSQKRIHLTSLIDCNREDAKTVLTSVRKWYYTKLGMQFKAQKRPGSFTFKVMSYNLLSQTLLDNHPYLYRSSRRENLDWNYRLNNLLQEISEQKSDILCFQEVEEDEFFNNFQPRLNECGYTGHFKKKTGNKVDGCAIFFKDKIFKLKKIVDVEYKHSEVKVLNRDNIGLIAILQPKRSKLQNKRLVIATTHLLFNLNRNDIRLAQIRVLLAEVERQIIEISNKGQKAHVILCGDLNTTPQSQLYQFLVNRNIDSSCIHSQNKELPAKDYLSLVPIGISNDTQFVESRLSPRRNLPYEESSSPSTSASPDDTFRHNLRLSSTYPLPHRLTESSSTCHSRANCTVDYIFYGVKSKKSCDAWGLNLLKTTCEGDLKLLGSYTLPSTEEMKVIGCLPNSYISSDHLCLISKFLLLY